MWSKSDMDYRTKSNDLLIKEMIKRADKLKNDPDKKKRLATNICKVCFYIPHIAGQGFTEYSCQHCDLYYTHPNTAVPRLCSDCAKRLNLCKSCGGKL